MFDFNKEKERFGKECSACGMCVEICPIIPLTDLKDADPGQVMEEVLGLYKDKRFNDIVKTRIYSCMDCNFCRQHCPEELDPGLGLTLARQILVEMGEPVPRGVSFLLPNLEFNLIRAIESVQVKQGEHPWLTNVKTQKPKPSETVLFAGCVSHMQPDLILTALELIRRIDPEAQALGGLNYCCGDIYLRAGNPEASLAQFSGLLEGLNTFLPKKVIFLCPTCYSFFNRHEPDTKWSWQFITDFLADHLDELGRLKEVKAEITIHGACHLVRGKKPDMESPRKILKEIPGITLKEMENSREESLCCGGSAMGGVGKPGADFRNNRLKQARDTGAGVMALYCPGCQSVFAQIGPDMPFEINSVITILGKSAGIKHEDKLLRYLSYHDGEKVLSEARECIESSGLPEEKLKYFLLKYFGK